MTFVIARNLTFAKEIARRIRAGEIPDLYPDDAAVRDAFANYLSPLKMRYSVYGVAL